MGFSVYKLEYKAMIKHQYPLTLLGGKSFCER